MSTLKKTFLSIGLCVVLLSTSYGVFQWLAGMKQPPAKRERIEKVYTVEVFEVEQADLREIISAFGAARAFQSVVLSAQVAGEVVEVWPGPPGHQPGQGLKVGQKMRAAEIQTLPSGVSQRSEGDLLLRIDPKTYREQVLQAQRRINEDNSELARLEKEQQNNDQILTKLQQDFKAYQEEYDRIKDLYDKGVAAKSEETRARLELQRYEAILIRAENEQKLFPLRREQTNRRIETHKSDLHLAQLNLDRTEVRPPFTGVVSEVMVERGQFVRIGDALLRLTDPSEVEIPVPLTLAEFARLEPELRAGHEPHVELAENETDEKRWEGFVVRSAPEADETTRTVKVFVHVVNDDQPTPLLPGTFVQARIDGPMLQNAMVVPRDAIINGNLFVVANLKPLDQPASKTGAAELSGTRTSRQGQERQTRVWEGTAEKRSVVIERTLQMLAIVKSGIKPGELIVLTNLDVVHFGVKVRVESRQRLKETLDRQRTRIVRPNSLAGGETEDNHDKVN